MEKQQLRNILEGALLAYGQPLSVEKLHSLFVEESTETDEGDQLPTKVSVDKKTIIETLKLIRDESEGHGYELKEVGSGWRFQVREETAPWVNKLWEEKPQRYSRALMETIAIIAYRQPITRGDIEEIRGVAVSSNIIRTLTEREWVKVIGQRDVPGRPSLYATTRQFLDYFNLASLDELPSLKELTDIEALMPELDLNADMMPAVPVSMGTVVEVTADTDIDSEEKTTGDIEGGDISAELEPLIESLEENEGEAPEQEQHVLTEATGSVSVDEAVDTKDQSTGVGDNDTEQVVH